VAGYNGTLSSFNRTSDKLSNYAINGNAKLGKFGLSVFLNAGYSDPVAQYNVNTTIPNSTYRLFAKNTGRKSIYEFELELWKCRIELGAGYS
jgi:hypothetical protein